MNKRENILVTIALVMITVMYFIAGYVDAHYTMTAEVYEIEDNSILLVDKTENIWEVRDEPELHKGDKVKIKFFNNGTVEYRQDDVIESVKVIP